MSSILSLIWLHNNTESKLKSWGGMTVIICKDFHQFKPVVQKAMAPLYWPSNTMNDSAEEVTSSELYGEFKTVVYLTHQMRVQDPEWTDFYITVDMGNAPKNIFACFKILSLDHTPVHT